MNGKRTLVLKCPDCTKIMSGILDPRIPGFRNSDMYVGRGGCMIFCIACFRVSKGVDQFKIFVLLKNSNNLVGTSDQSGQGPSFPVGTMSQVQFFCLLRLP